MDQKCVRCGRKTEERVAGRLRGTGRWKRKTAYYLSATYISRNERERGAPTGTNANGYSSCTRWDYCELHFGLGRTSALCGPYCGTGTNWSQRPVNTCSTCTRR